MASFLHETAPIHKIISFYPIQSHLASVEQPSNTNTNPVLFQADNTVTAVLYFLSSPLLPSLVLLAFYGNFTPCTISSSHSSPHSCDDRRCIDIDAASHPTSHIPHCIVSRRRCAPTHPSLSQVSVPVVALLNPTSWLAVPRSPIRLDSPGLLSHATGFAHYSDFESSRVSRPTR